MTEPDTMSPHGLTPYTPTTGSLLWRCAAWAVVGLTAAFLLNNYLTVWRGWPGPGTGGDTDAALAWIQAAVYLGALVLATLLARRRNALPLRADARLIYAVSAYLIRAWFWIAILVGVADLAISFMRVEGLLTALLGEEATANLGRSHFRGTYVHLPLIAASFAIAAFTRTLGFHWLALLVVVAELQVVVGRFIFSYEQAFMGDIVRFWYAGLFLFASAYTLIEEGHVRVDVVYTNFGPRVKGLVNAFGSILLGMSLCVVIIAVGMTDKTSIINSALINFEISQAGFGMYIKYLMAGFLGVFAVSMMLQFAGYMLDGIADWRDEPGKREPAGGSAH
jgi:TRAP-type mannitol/chloroaromatic compound transport system permease small subunit